MTITSRAEIERILAEINEAENSADLTAAQKSQVIDTVSTSDVQGWANGVARGGREQEREQEAFLWSAIPDYHRAFDKVIIDPPRAAVAWRMTGHLGEESIDLTGSTIFEFDESARITQFWMYYNDPQS
jgi:hypothetical protein